MALIGYARVSKRDQNVSLQMDALRGAGVDRRHIHVDQVNRLAGLWRPGLSRALHALAPGDTLVVWKVDRLGGSLRAFVELSDYLSELGCHFRSITEGLDTSTPIGRALIPVLVAFANMDLLNIRERVAAGMESMRARGVKNGRPAALAPGQVLLVRQQHHTDGTSQSELARVFNVSRQVIGKVIDRVAPYDVVDPALPRLARRSAAVSVAQPRPASPPARARRGRGLPEQAG